MKHHASARFWQAYRALPTEIRALADAKFSLLKNEPQHPSLHFKKIGAYWSARVGLHYRALAVESGADLVWFWIGSHADYDVLLGRQPAKKALQPPSRMKRKPSAKRRRKATRG